MYEEISRWILVFGGGFCLVFVFAISIGYWLEQRRKKKRDEIWEEIKRKEG